MAAGRQKGAPQDVWVEVAQRDVEKAKKIIRRPWRLRRSTTGFNTSTGGHVVMCSTWRRS